MTQCVRLFAALGFLILALHLDQPNFGADCLDPMELEGSYSYNYKRNYGQSASQNGNDVVLRRLSRSSRSVPVAEEGDLIRNKRTPQVWSHRPKPGYGDKSIGSGGSYPSKPGCNGRRRRQVASRPPKKGCRHFTYGGRFAKNPRYPYPDSAYDHIYYVYDDYY